MQVLVTGGVGFVGSHLVRALCQRPDVTRVSVLDNMLRGRLSRLGSVIDNPKLTVINADLRDPQALVDALAGIDLVYHLAAQSSVMGSIHNADYCFTTNVAGTYGLLNAAITAGVRRLVFTSSCEVYGEPTQLPVAESAPLSPKNDYGASKIAGEAYVRLYQNKLQTAILRLANVYGPEDEGRVIPIFINHALNGDPIELFGGEQVIDFVWIGTVVEALIAAGFADSVPDGPINVASGRGTALRDVAARVALTVGSASPIVIRPAQSPEVVRFIADTSRMRTILHIRPAADPLEHLPAVVASFKEMWQAVDQAMIGERS